MTPAALQTLARHDERLDSVERAVAGLDAAIERIDKKLWGLLIGVAAGSLSAAATLLVMLLKH